MATGSYGVASGCYGFSWRRSSQLKALFLLQRKPSIWSPRITPTNANYWTNPRIPTIKRVLFATLWLLSSLISRHKSQPIDLRHAKSWVLTLSSLQSIFNILSGLIKIIIKLFRQLLLQLLVRNLKQMISPAFFNS